CLRTDSGNLHDGREPRVWLQRHDLRQRVHGAPCRNLRPQRRPLSLTVRHESRTGLGASSRRRANKKWSLLVPLGALAFGCQLLSGLNDLEVVSSDAPGGAAGQTNDGGGGIDGG